MISICGFRICLVYGDQKMLSGLSIVKCFSQVKDPRIERTKQHLLVDIFCLAIFAVVAENEGWEDIEQCGKLKYEWLKKYL